MSYPISRKQIPHRKGIDMSRRKHLLSPEQLGRAAAEGAEANLPMPPADATELERRLWLAASCPPRGVKAEMRDFIRAKFRRQGACPNDPA